MELLELLELRDLLEFQEPAVLQVRPWWLQEELQELPVEEQEERTEPTLKGKIPESSRWMRFRRRAPTRVKVRPEEMIKNSIPERPLSGPHTSLRRL